jgi:hypothetical protein
MGSRALLVIGYISTLATAVTDCSKPSIADEGATNRSLSWTPDSATARAILGARDAIWHAWFTHDTVALDQLLPGAVAAGEGIGEDQRWADRTQVAAQSKQFVAARGTLIKLDFARTEIHQYGDVAVVFSVYDVQLSANGWPQTTHGRATEVFVRRDGRWINPFWHLGPGN